MKTLTRDPKSRKAVKVGGDTALIVAAWYLSIFLRFDGNPPPAYMDLFLNTLPLVLIAKVLILRSYHLYEYSWRYMGVREHGVLLKALTLASLCVLAAYALVAGLVAFPRSVFLLDWLLCFIFLAAFRAVSSVSGNHRLNGPIRWPVLRNGGEPPARAKRVLLYGAGDLGASIARQIRDHYGRSKKIIGFIDDDSDLKGVRIHGIRVLGDRKALPHVVQKCSVDEILITISAVAGRQLNEIVEACRKICSCVQVAPGVEELFMGKVRVSDLREVRIEDLLGREKVVLDEERLNEFLHGKTILVTGAGGSIGSELCFQILKFSPRQLILFGKGENSIYEARLRLAPHALPGQLTETIGDIVSFCKVDRVFSRLRPDIVFHAAADKHVPLMEANPDEAVLTNIIGTRNVLRAASANGIQKLVCISSDKAVNPRSVMGCCKRISELLVQHYNSPRTTACAVRFGNVLGSRGSVIPLFKRQIAAGGPVTVTDPEIARYFMTIPEAVLLVLQAGAVCQGGEVFLLEMGQPVRIVDLARQMIRLSGLSEDRIAIEFSGLRAGEKLHEELAFHHESLQQTPVSKLYRIESRPVRILHLDHRIDRLGRLARDMDYSEIQATLKELVPEYQPLTEYPSAGAVRANSVS